MPSTTASDRNACGYTQLKPGTAKFCPFFVILIGMRVSLVSSPPPLTHSLSLSLSLSLAHSPIFPFFSAGYQECNGALWKAYSTELTHAQAEVYCHSEQSSLATVRTHADRLCYQTAVSNVSGIGPYVWLGFNDRHTEGRHVWADGREEAANSSNWYQGQPASGQLAEQQDCGYGLKGGWLGDQDCQETMPFLCQVIASGTVLPRSRCCHVGGAHACCEPGVFSIVEGQGQDKND